MPTNQSDIGSAQFRLSVDSTEFSAGLNRARAEAEKSSQSMASAFKSQVGAFTSFVGKASAAIGVFSTFYAIGERLGTLLRSTAPDVEQFAQAIEKLGNAGPADQLRALAERMRDLQNANTGTLLNTIQNLSQGQTNAQVREQIALLEQTIRVQELRLQRAREEEDKKREADELKAADKRIGRVRLTEDEVNAIVREQEEKRLDEADARAKKQGADQIENQRNQFDYYNQQLEDMLRERKQREQEVLDILRSQTAEYLRQVAAFQDLQARQTAGFGFGQLNATMEAVLQSVNRVANQIPSGR